MNTESSKANEGSRSHEKALMNRDDDGAKRDTIKKRVDDYDLGNTAHESKENLISVMWKICKTGDGTESLQLGAFQQLVVMLQVECGEESMIR